ncbi:MAG: hypothetical protein M1421_03800 [Candidatus Eremiobacteraeota bacterium]|nr:hypothetical protein [Candidatus Eremiobacteraeota bacterium]
MQIWISLSKAAGIFRKRAGLFIAWIFTHLLISGFLGFVYFIGLFVLFISISTIFISPFTMSHQPMVHQQIAILLRSFFLFIFSSKITTRISFTLLFPLLCIIGIPFFAIVSSQFSIGCYKLAFNVLKNREAKFPEFFQFQKFWGNLIHSFLFSWLLLSSIGFGLIGWIDGFFLNPIYIIGLFILITAFFYYFLAYRFVKPILAEEKTGFLEAMSKSRSLVDRNLFPLIILFIYFPLFGILISIGGKLFETFSPFIAIPVSLFTFIVALSIVPLQCCSVAVAYEEAEKRMNTNPSKNPLVPLEPWLH